MGSMMGGGGGSSSGGSSDVPESWATQTASPQGSVMDATNALMNATMNQFNEPYNPYPGLTVADTNQYHAETFGQQGEDAVFSALPAALDQLMQISSGGTSPGPYIPYRLQSPRVDPNALLDDLFGKGPLIPGSPPQTAAADEYNRIMATQPPPAAAPAPVQPPPVAAPAQLPAPAPAPVQAPPSITPAQRQAAAQQQAAQLAQQQAAQLAQQRQAQQAQAQAQATALANQQRQAQQAAVKAAAAAQTAAAQTAATQHAPPTASVSTPWPGNFGLRGYTGSADPDQGN